MAKKIKPPRIYFCFRSPYSWIATRLIEEYLPAAEREQLEYQIFWQPDAITEESLQKQGGDFVYNHMNRERHLYILQDIKRITSTLNWQHVWPIDEDPWWELPTLAYLKAEELNAARIFRNALFKARWEDGLNIHQLDVIRQVANACQLDADEIAGAADDEAIKQKALDAALNMSNDEVFGVPFFIYRRHKFWGVDRLNEFVALLRGQDFNLVDLNKLQGQLV